jgi:hypothetical protein
MKHLFCLLLALLAAAPLAKGSSSARAAMLHAQRSGSRFWTTKMGEPFFG